MSPRKEIDRSRLFERLARGQAERLIVLTPNRRLAQALEADFDRFQLARGLGAWEAPLVSPLADFIREAYEAALYAPGGGDLPTLLSEHQERLLWEEAVRSGDWREKVLSVGATASMAADAWKLAHDWRIESALDVWPGNEDHEAFRAWRSHYRRRTERERFVDRARLPALVATLLAEGRTEAPSAIVLYAFDLAKPAESDFLDACSSAGIEVLACAAPTRRATITRLVLDSPRHEIELAAHWARSRLEQMRAPKEAVPAQAAKARRNAKATASVNQGELFSASDVQVEAPAPPAVLPSAPTESIAIVVPDLQERRAEVVRIFARVLGPRGFNVSFAPPLASAPLVDAALTLLDLASEPIAFDRASRLLRSPFVAGAEAEMAARARLDLGLRRMAPAKVSLLKLRSLVAGEMGRRAGSQCPRLAALLDRMLEAAKHPARAAPQAWARSFTALVDAAGFPGERSLDSDEFQTLAKWREALSALSTLGNVAETWSVHEARTQLRRIATDTTFQPASGSAPVQVLGVLESAGLAFDHLWVSGLTDDAWPLPTQPQPLIPVGLQRKAGIPQATPERSFAVDAAFTAAWRQAAGEVVFSSARAQADRELLPSALVSEVAESKVDALAIPRSGTQRDALFASGRQLHAIAKRHDEVPPPIVGLARGGTGILVDQAACPFRAFAHHRLAARELERPEPGLGAPERGLLLHAMMARLWSELKDHASLVATDETTLATMIDAAAAHAVEEVRLRHPGPLEGEFARLERERLASIAKAWLEVERQRAPFEVKALEAPMRLSAGRLEIDGRIDRIDRIVDGDGLAIIDYKAGANLSAYAWMGARPDDCQLPLYALAAADEDVRAVSFARLKVGKLGFTGIAREANLLPRVGPIASDMTRKFGPASWDELIASWRQETAKLGDAFATGVAHVDPKNMLSTCERCDLQPLCRVHERIGTLDEGEPFEESE